MSERLDMVGGDDAIFWYYSDRNQSPRVTAQFLARQRALLTPGQYAREHENQWVDQADSFTTQADVDAAMARHPGEPPRGLPGLGYGYAVDLGLVADVTAIALGHLLGPDLVVDKLVTLAGSKKQPVKISDVRRTLEHLTADFPPVCIAIESWQGIALAEQLGQTLPVEVVTPTMKSNTETWPLLLQRLTERTIVLPRHARLREELLGLVVEVGPTGARVVDRGRAHQDHAVTCRMLCKLLEPWTATPVSYEPDAYDRGVLDSFASYIGAPVSGQVVDDEAGFQHSDMTWSRVGPDGIRRPLW
jgi:hypothetical protein